MRFFRCAARELVFLGLAFLLVIGIAEITLRLNDDFGRNGPGRMGKRPNEAGVEMSYGRPWYHREFRTPVAANSAGFPAREFAAQPNRPVRLAVLGDSYVEGFQLELDHRFVSVAEDELQSVQLLALGRSGAYLPAQLQFADTQLPGMFGPDQQWPEIDGVIVCVRLWGGLNLALGGVAYPVTLPEMPWQWDLKSPLTGWVRWVAIRLIDRPSHGLSLWASKTNAWLSADLRNQKRPLTSKNLRRAANVIETEALGGLVGLMESREKPLAFIYLPSVQEVAGTASPAMLEMKSLLLAAIARTGVPWTDTTESFAGDSSVFFPDDRHPDRDGHAIMAGELALLVRQMLEAK